MASEADLRAEAKNFCESLGNVFMMKKRDPQTQHLLQKSKSLIESLLSEKRGKTDRPSIPPKPASRSGGGGGMGQLWVKLDELKRENENLRRRQLSKGSEDKGSLSKSQGPGEVIIAELHKTKQENDLIKGQLEKSRTLVKELENVNASMQDEFKRTKIAQELAQDALERVKREHKHLESSLSTVKHENDSLKMRLTHSVKPMKRPDPKFVENINEKCRPSNVALFYTTLESQAWVDAKEGLEDAGYDDECRVTHFLCRVVMLCYDVSCELLNDVESSLVEILKNPTRVLDRSSVNSAKESSPLADDFINSIKEVLRQNIDGLDVEPLVNDCKEKLIEEGSWEEFEGILSHKLIVRYIEQCAHVTWQMVVQQTPMWLSTCDTQFDDAVHKLWWSCNQSEATEVDYFIWPALYDFKNGTLMVKGCVHAS